MSDKGTGTEGSAATQERADLTRKEFLTKATLGVGGLLGVAVVAPAATMALAPVFSGGTKRTANAGPADNFEEGVYTKVVLRYGEDDNAYVEDLVAFVRKNADNYVDTVTKEKGGYTVISNTCVHLGCPVTETGGQFACPCHGGSYNEDGARVAGPPPRPLDRFEYEVRDGNLWIGDRYSLAKEGDKYVKVPARGPAQATSGLQGLLYKLQP